jgi:hypothetical protein
MDFLISYRTHGLLAVWDVRALLVAIQRSLEEMRICPAKAAAET